MAPSTSTRRYAWYVVGVLTLANISGFIDRQVLSLLVRPIQRDFGITDTQMSYLLGLSFAIFFSLLGLPIARLADRTSRRGIIGSGVALWSVFTMLSSTARTFGRLFALRLGVGIGEASLQAPGVSLIADYFPHDARGRAMSVYSLGIFLGSGLAYFIGGWVVTVAGGDGQVVLPVFGAVRPWQTVFVAVGLPGLVIALLILFTVREPARTTGASSAAPLSELGRWVRANRATYLTHGLGFALSAAVNFALAAWIPTLLVRVYGWHEGRAGMWQGALTSTIGVIGVLAGGRVADWYVARGTIDGPMRVGMIGAVGMLISATAFPLAPNATLAIAWLAVVNFFAAFPWGAASAAAAEIAPPALRAQGAAIYFLLINLVSQTLGPMAVGLFNDHVFGRGTGVRWSLAIINVVGMTAALALFAAGLGAYRRTLMANRHSGISPGSVT